VRDQSLAINYGDGLTTANGTQVFDEVGLKFRDAYLLRDLMMSTSGHIDKKRTNKNINSVEEYVLRRRKKRTRLSPILSVTGRFVASRQSQAVFTERLA
jgi:hypothetical protein